MEEAWPERFDGFKGVLSLEVRKDVPLGLGGRNLCSNQ